MDDLPEVTEVESLCVNCESTGITRLLLVSLPHFREVVVGSFACEDCGFESSEIQPAQSLQDYGVHYELFISPSAAVARDLNRQIVKSEHASVIIPEIDFEAPASTVRGEINTVEGFLSTAAANLTQILPYQPEATAAALQTVVDKLVMYASGEAKEPFTFILDDPSGNSFVENPFAPDKDPFCVLSHFVRTLEQQEALGYVQDRAESSEAEEVKEGEEGERKFPDIPSIPVSEGLRAKLDTFIDVTREAAEFPETCHSCLGESSAVTRMCLTDIPYFGKVLLMVSQCDVCGFKDVEVKPGGSVRPLGKRVTLRVTSVDDLQRDLLKSDTASVSIPELEFEMEGGTLGGKYTTVEGLLEDVFQQLKGSNHFLAGDSALPEDRDRFEEFLQRFDALRKCGEGEFTVVVDDPLGNVFIGSALPGGGDPALDAGLTVEEYVRSFEQNEELGLNDIDVD